MTARSSVFSCVIATALGHLGLAWCERGLLRVVLPQGDAGAAGRELAARHANAVALDRAELPGRAPAMARLAELARGYCEGEAADFSGVAVAFDGIDPFRRAIYASARKFGYGETTTYGALAEDAGFPGAARETGTALGRNPVPLVVPCHRVLAAGGRIGGFSAPGGAAAKARLLSLEGAWPYPGGSAQASLPF